MINIYKLNYDILFNTCLFINKQEDLYNFLCAINKEQYYEEFCKKIFLHYIEILKKYYIYIKNKKKYIKPENEEDELDFYLNLYLYDIINNKINYNDHYESSPFDDTNTFTRLCSEMIKEYNIIDEKILDDEYFIFKINSILNL
jgi:hypothetical protein